MKVNIKKGWKSLRIEAYGTAEQQLEFIYDNGIEAYFARQKAIKDAIPKEGDNPEGQ